MTLLMCKIWQNKPPGLFSGTIASQQEGCGFDPQLQHMNVSLFVTQLESEVLF